MPTRMQGWLLSFRIGTEGYVKALLEDMPRAVAIGHDGKIHTGEDFQDPGNPEDAKATVQALHEAVDKLADHWDVKEAPDAE